MNGGESDLLIFLHIPRTAGTTLRWVLEAQYPRAAVLRCYPNLGCRREQIVEMPEEEKRAIRLLCSHLPYGTHDLFPQPATYVTMLRDPVNRVISAHYHSVSRGTVQTDINTQYTARSRPINRQARLVAGVPRDREVTAADLEVAKRNLSGSSVVMGLSERFDESLALFSEVFDWKRVVYVKRHVLGAKRRKQDIKPETLEAIEAANQLDAELYKFAEHLFETNLASHQVTEDQVNRIRRQNLILQARLYVSRALRRRS